MTSMFLQSLRQSHIAAASAELVFPGGGAPVAVAVEAGSVTIDRTAQSRRSGSITIPWTLGQDPDIRSLPLGGYCLVRRGVRYADGTTELALLGRLRVESVNWDTLAATAGLELTDRMAQIRDEPFTAPWSPRGLQPHAAAFAIVQQVFGDTIAYTAPYQPPDAIGDITYTGSRADALAALEQSYGAETYFDANGDFVFARKPQGDAAAVWTVDAGDSGVLVNAQENLDRTGIYNGVLVTGQGTADQPPVTALAVYDVASSPVRWGGPFGKVALLADSTSASTVEQATATAQALLALRLKATRSLTLTSAPNPALEAGDTIRVRFPDGRDETHLVDATTISLNTDAQGIVTRTLFAPSSTVMVGLDAWQEMLAA